MNAPVITRRDFAAGLGGIVLAFGFPATGGAEQGRLPGSLNNNRMLSAWIAINADGTATVMTGKVELGQGILTALAQIAAEELDLPLGRVTIISGDTARAPNEGYTQGSTSIQDSGTALRLAGAEVRAILLDLAAKKLGVPVAGLKVDAGTIAAPDGRTLTYGALAAETDLKREATGKIAPKRPTEHRVVGRSVPRLDLPAKVTGGAAFVQDWRLPGMLPGRVARPPQYGAQLEALDEAKVRAMPGVIAVVRDGSFLGVIAGREEQSIKAVAALGAAAKWKPGPALPDPAHLYEQLKALPTQDTIISSKDAPLTASNAKSVEATYFRPYQAHASIGPSCAVAQMQDGRLTVWTHTQGVAPLRGAIARALGMKPGMVRCIFMEGAGCYGHNGADDAAFDAVLLARAANGRPVRVQWMRDEEFMWEPYGPAMIVQVRGAVADGRIVDWTYDLWSQAHNLRPGDAGGLNLLSSWYLASPHNPSPARQGGPPNFFGDRNAVPTYELPRQRITNHLIKDSPLRTSALRSLGAYGNVFAVESFMDELAGAAGIDPIAFRLAHLKDPRARAVIEAVAKAANWQVGETSNGTRGRGIGFARYKTVATYNAVIVEVEIDRASGKVSVPRAWTAVDAGQIVTPDGLINQIEGGIIQSTSWTLHEHIRFDRNGIMSRDWTSYPILAMPDVPKVETVLLNQPAERPLGAGEASLGPTAAAIANAFAAATGRRLRELPFTPERVKDILA
jgi:CO/xanthine dehydrogenase Mo-binding subunit